MKYVTLETYRGDPPAYQSAGAAGIDLTAAKGTWRIVPSGECLIPTGLCVAIPDGHFGQIVMRSGMGIKKNLSCHVGTIDSDYRGEIMVLVRNHGRHPVEIEPGQRFAQLIVQPCVQVDLEPADSLEGTERGARGFGSTGR